MSTSPEAGAGLGRADDRRGHLGLDRRPQVPFDEGADALAQLVEHPRARAWLDGEIASMRLLGTSGGQAQDIGKRQAVTRYVSSFGWALGTEFATG
jgi:hypothetical protein